MTIKDKHLMPSERYVMIRTLEDKLAIIKSMGQHEMFVTTDLMQEILEMLKEQEPKTVKIKKNAYNHKFYYCPRCDRGFEDFFRKPMFCDKCGQAVKWDS